MQICLIEVNNNRSQRTTCLATLRSDFATAVVIICAENGTGSRFLGNRIVTLKVSRLRQDEPESYLTWLSLCPLFFFAWVEVTEGAATSPGGASCRGYRASSLLALWKCPLRPPLGTLAPSGEGGSLGTPPTATAAAAIAVAEPVKCSYLKACGSSRSKSNNGARGLSVIHWKVDIYLSGSLKIWNSELKIKPR